MTSEHDVFHALKFDEVRLILDDVVFTDLKYEYRGEGNENLVLSLPKAKLILRLRKNRLNENVEPVYEKKKLTISLLYHYLFTRPFFSDKYLTLPILAEISNSIMKQLDHNLFAERPDHRRDKRILFNGIEIHPDYTFLLQYVRYLQLKNRPKMEQAQESNTMKKIFSREYLDFRCYIYSLLTNPFFMDHLNNSAEDAKIPTFSVEIKPKQAWTAEGYRHFDICAFCMNQYFKLKENKIETRSQYCPLDLFSGFEMRMKKAIKGLLQTPQNNLKIFKNGEVVFAEKLPNDVNQILNEWFGKVPSQENNEWCQEHFCKLIIAVLTHEFVKDQQLLSFKTEPFVKSSSSKICSDEKLELLRRALFQSKLKCEYTYKSFPKNCILSRIMELQRLDEVGLESVHDFYQTKMKKYSDDFSFLTDLISRIKFQSGDVDIPVLNVAEAYTFSTAAKDLSIMIAVRSVMNDSEKPSEFIIDVDNMKYEINVSVIDVGPKPLSCIGKHWKRDKKIVTACLNFLYPNL